MKINTNKWISHLVRTSSMSNFYSSLLTGTQLPSSGSSNPSFSCNNYSSTKFASAILSIRLHFPLQLKADKNLILFWLWSLVHIIHRHRFLSPIKSQTGDIFSRESHSHLAQNFDAIQKLHCFICILTPRTRLSCCCCCVTEKSNG